MRFATKILLLTLAMTLGLSALIVWVVTQRITAAERERADQMTLRAIQGYADRVEERGDITMRLARLLLEEPQIRAYLQEVDATPEPAEATIAQLREEIFGRLLQTELRFRDIEPAFQVLGHGRRGVVLVAGPHTDDPALAAGVAAHPWPVDALIDAGQSRQIRIVVHHRLYHVFAIPLRVEIGGEGMFAHFVAYEVNDAWVRHFARAQDWLDLRVVVQLDGRIIARSAPADAVERELSATLRNLSASTHNELAGIQFVAAGERFAGEALLLSDEAQGAAIAFVTSLDRALAPLRDLQRAILITTGGAILLAVVVSGLISRMLAKPVEQLVVGTERIARGQFNVPIDLRRGDELGVLARSFNQMAAGLEQRDLIKDTFGKFVDPSIVQSLLEDPTRLKLGGERRVQTVLFADLENFSSLSEQLDPEALFKLLNAHLEDAADVVAEHRGIIDKFMGDGVVAFWGPPMEQHHAVRACRAALHLAQRTRERSCASEQIGLPPLRVRIGIATGEVLVGNIGSRSKYNYTVMGDVANLASRLEGVNKLYGTQILVSERTRREAGTSVVVRKIDTVRVLGRSEPVELYEVLGESGSVDGQLDERLRRYDVALRLYHARRWSEAREAFDQLDDAPSRAMAGRCAVLTDQPPSAAWDGVWNLDRK